MQTAKAVVHQPIATSIATALPRQTITLQISCLVTKVTPILQCILDHTQVCRHSLSTAFKLLWLLLKILNLLRTTRLILIRQVIGKLYAAIFSTCKGHSTLHTHWAFQHYLYLYCRLTSGNHANKPTANLNQT